MTKRLSRVDRAALRLAVEAARRESKGRARQIAAKLEDEPWEQVAKFCATVAQGRALQLKPWELCPCDVHPGDLETAQAHHRAAVAYTLQQKMRRLGISKFHPDPLAAIAEVESATASAK